MLEADATQRKWPEMGVILISTTPRCGGLTLFNTIPPFGGQGLHQTLAEALAEGARCTVIPLQTQRAMPAELAVPWGIWDRGIPALVGSPGVGVVEQAGALVNGPIGTRAACQQRRWRRGDCGLVVELVILLCISPLSPRSVVVAIGRRPRVLWMGGVVVAAVRLQRLGTGHERGGSGGPVAGAGGRTGGRASSCSCSAVWRLWWWRSSGSQGPSGRRLTRVASGRVMGFIFLDKRPRAWGTLGRHAGSQARRPAGRKAGRQEGRQQGRPAISAGNSSAIDPFHPPVSHHPSARKSRPRWHIRGSALTRVPCPSAVRWTRASGNAPVTTPPLLHGAIRHVQDRGVCQIASAAVMHRNTLSTLPSLPSPRLAHKSAVSIGRSEHRFARRTSCMASMDGRIIMR
jgi:hypothetical protein